MKYIVCTDSIFQGPLMSSAHLFNDGHFEVSIIKMGQQNEYLSFSEFKEKYEDEKDTPWYNTFANFYLYCEGEFKRRVKIK